MLLFGMTIILFLIYSFFFLLSFTKKRDAEDALDRMDGIDIDGREIRVQFARYGRASTTDSREKFRRRR
jgi:arginine/serine-rich splicing factor 2